MNWSEKFISRLTSGSVGNVTGLSGSCRSFFLHQLREACPHRCLLILTSGEEAAYDVLQGLRTFQRNEPTALEIFPAHHLIFQRHTLGRNEIQRMQTLQALLQHPAGLCIVASAASLLLPLKAPEQLRLQSLQLAVGKETAFSSLGSQLSRMGYQRTVTLTAPGEYALRGGIVDIFPLDSETPFRIEFFGDEPESIRRFDLNSQRSLAQQPTLSIFPVNDLQQGKQPGSTLFHYLPPDTLLFIDEPLKVEEEYDRQQQRLEAYQTAAKKENADFSSFLLTPFSTLKQQIGAFTRIIHSYFPSKASLAEDAIWNEHISQQEMEPFFRHEELFMERMQQWHQQNYTIAFATPAESRWKELQKKLLEQHLNGCTWLPAALERGFVSSTLRYALVAEPDLGGKRRPSRHQKNALQGERILLENLQIGDYVVHEQYGIGIFHGITQVSSGGSIREYLLLQYAGTDKLYLPIEKLELLYRYNGNGEAAPKLHRLGGHEWERTKAKVIKSVQDMTAELTQLYAARNRNTGYAFHPDTPWQREFEDKFPYQETPGQLQAILDTKQDMELPRPMDRIICGDVGYGKTEVCLRAAFKAVMDSKQVAVLVPTTVLAEQHYTTFRERCADYPVHIEVLSRFRTAAQQKQTLKEMARGTVDIVIATHRLLSKDIAFHDLGLLIVDEEHRFGVAQKEKIKQLKTQVDVLSLSATPIPRSLNMALTGLRDLSVIDTAPAQRYPVTTYVLEYDEELIVQAIRNEVERDGQVFFVHNRVQDIDAVYQRLHKLLPDIRIGIGHGQMNEIALENAIHDFIERQFDLFLCTTIIESGLDIPNANTMIVDMADYMGLAQLYQLRGRIGRSNRMAYAYITYRPQKSLTEEAQKRLNALREFNEVGAGMKIALRDLEIRGAGNLLGAEQHGHIHSIGFDLYCRIIEEETAKLRGQSTPQSPMPQMDVDVDLYIPESYIPDAGTRLQMYRRLLMVTEDAEIDDIRNELQDRFGEYPPTVENLMQIARLKLKARSQKVKSLKKKGSYLYLKLDFDNLIHAAQGVLGKNAKILDEETLCIRLNGKTTFKELQNILSLL